MADLFPIVRDSASGTARNLIEATDTLLLGIADRDTAGLMSLGETTATSINLGSVTTSGDITFGARLSTITLNEVGQESLDVVYTATSIIGALNELVAGPGILTDLNEAYDHFGANPATITIDNAEGQGDLTWSPTGAFSFNIDLAANTGVADGFSVVNGTDQFNLIYKGVNLMDLDADLQTVEIDTSVGISLDAVAASNFTVSGATADLTLGARAATITLNELGDTVLVGYVATSIVGALNEVMALSSAITLDDAYNNDAGAALITVDAGDVSWALTGAYSFNIDLTPTTGTADGFQVNNGTDYYRILYKAANTIDIEAYLDTVTWVSSDYFDLTAAGTYGLKSTASTTGAVTNYGLFGLAKGDTGRGVYGEADKTGAYTNYGGSFQAHGDTGRGVSASAMSTNAATNYGGYFIAKGTTGMGVFGWNTTTGAYTNYGGNFEAAGDTGRGVYGKASASGAFSNYGGYFHAGGDSGYGAYAFCNGPTGTGVRGDTSGATAYGVYGYASSTAAGTNYGGYFLAKGTTAQAVYGAASKTGAYLNYGGYFSAAGDTSRAVYGIASSTNASTNYGGYFVAKGTTGIGVIGWNTTTGAYANYGGYFEAAGDSGRGVYGDASSVNPGTNYGGYFIARGTTGRGVEGTAFTTGAYTNYGGHFTSNGDTGYAVYGEASSTNAAANYGGLFLAKGTIGVGVYGWADKTGAYLNYGGSFRADGDTGRGVSASAMSTNAGINYGGYFVAKGTIGVGVLGWNTTTGAYANYGGYFEAAGDTGRGVYGKASAVGAVSNYGGQFTAGGDTGYAVYAAVTPNTAYSGYFSGGKFTVTGYGDIAFISSNGDITFDDQYLGAAIPISEAGVAGLVGFTATSIVGALNELAASVGNVTLDVAYNNDAGAAAITVDAGDLTVSPTGAYSLVVDVSGCTGTADGFNVNNGADYFRVLFKAANTIDIESYLDTYSVSVSDKINITGGGSTYIFNVTSTYGSSFTTSGNTGNSQLRAISGNASATGAIENIGGYFSAGGDSGNGVKAYLTGATAIGLNAIATGATAKAGRFNASGSTDVNYAVYAETSSATGYSGYFTGGKFAVTSVGDQDFTLTGATSHNIDLTACTGASTDGFQVNNGADYFRVLYGAADTINWYGQLAGVDVTASGNWNSTCSLIYTVNATNGLVLATSAGDLTLNDQYLGAAIPISEAGVAGLVGFTATSIVGALNELAAGGIAPTLDDCYNNDAGAASIDVDAGDVTWTIDGHQFIIEIQDAANLQGFRVQDTAESDYFELIKHVDASIDWNCELNAVDLNFAGDCSIDVGSWIAIASVGGADFGTTSGDVEISTTTAGDILLTGAEDIVLDAGSDINFESCTNTIAAISPNGYFTMKIGGNNVKVATYVAI